MIQIREYILKCKQFFIYAGIFSFVINLLVLIPMFYMLQIYDRVLSSRSVETLVMLTVITAFLMIMQSMLESFRSKLFVRTSATLHRMLQGPVLDSMLRIRRLGEQNRHALDDLHLLQSFFNGRGIQGIFEIPWIPIYVAILWMFHPMMAGMALIGAIILLSLTFIEDRMTSANQKAAGESRRRSQDYLNTALQNTEIISALSMRRTISSEWSRLNDQFLDANLKASDSASSVSAFSTFVRAFMQIAAMGTCAFIILEDQSISSGIMIASTMIMNKALAPISKVIESWRHFTQARVAYGKLSQLLKDYRPDETRVMLPSVRGNLSVEKLYFAISKEKEVLFGLNFMLSAGESLGIVGQSASGKTTLSRLLVGIYKPTDGAIRLDGADIFQWNQSGELGPHIGYLPQSIELFSGTVAENIARMGQVDVNKVMAAAQKVGAHEMILRLTHGYDTQVGDFGMFLSAGQRQLVGLARALYTEPKYIVLDEPNANLDGPAELELLRLIRELKKEKCTVILISHKPSVLRDIDKILVISQGRQTMFGPKDEVMPKVTGASEPRSTNLSVVQGGQE